jgi:protoporphyrin/coproporphyrin ferrochelatase
MGTSHHYDGADVTSQPHRRTAVFLMNLGGPRNLAEVRPFLFDLFADKKILQVPALIRYPLAALIATLRAPSSRSKYALIGNRSPLVEATQAQAQALDQRLGQPFKCFLAMRCGHPDTRQAVGEALAWGAEQAVGLPLYPQFARATTLSSEEELRARWPSSLPLHEIHSYPTEPLFVAAAALCLNEALAQLAPESRAQRLVIFSAHGLPMRDVRAGDPYESEVKATVAAVASRCGLGAEEWRLTYQSRVRPREWLGPDTVETVRKLAAGRALVLVPIAFVSEHLETLYDLDILARQAAERAGAVQVVRARTPGTRTEFIAALADLVYRALGGPARADLAS